METAGQEVGKIETRLRQLGTRLDRLVAKAEAVGTEAKLDYRKQIEHAKEKQTVVRDKLNAYRASSGQKWDNFKGGVETAWQELEVAFKALKH
jgi:septation ring formation regulator EzrA